jgi:rubrerythrin
MSKLDGASWSIDDIPYGEIDAACVRDDRQLFEIVTSASFIEITSDLYTKNLVEFFRDDREIADWLEQHWEKEELQHGAALKKYVQTAWPEFDWEAAYASFRADYGALCTVEALAGTKALEMVARCVVETGTASFYRMLSDLSPEPVLRQLTAEISNDEVRHYKHFHRYFLRYRQLERPSRLAVMRTLLKRAADVDAEDTFYAFRAVFRARHPDVTFERADYDAYRDGVLNLVRQHFPHGMAVKMLLKPLDMNPLVSRAMLPTVTQASRLFLRRYDRAA